MVEKKLSQMILDKKLHGKYFLQIMATGFTILLYKHYLLIDKRKFTKKNQDFQEDTKGLLLFQLCLIDIL